MMYTLTYLAGLATRSFLTTTEEAARQIAAASPKLARVRFALIRVCVKRTTTQPVNLVQVFAWDIVRNLIESDQ